ncbi:MAG: hypothetical protein LUK37_03600 [Clostridia bacterium]|nr:hypothetical protein [Clostridia bacterium]
MRKTMRKLVTLGMVTCLTFASCLTSFAGEWKKDTEYGGYFWWYQRDDGSYPMNCWETIDGKSYHFDFEGYLETDCITEDGYHVDENGAWIESIPQMSREEMSEYYNSLFKEMLIDWYEHGIISSEEELEECVNLYFLDPVEAGLVLDEIRNNYSMGSAQY